MIISTFGDTSPATYEGNTIKLLGKSLPSVDPDNVSEICICDFIKCTYEERVFASDESDWWKNDKNDFLFRRIIAADTVAMSIYKNGVKLDDLTDDTYGTYYDSFNGSDEQQLYKGYLIDWQKVKNVSGVGSYQIKADLNIMGVETTFESRKFELAIYSDRAAHETVRIESYQNGSLFGSNFDFTGLNWYSSVRIPGVFGNPTPEYETDRYVTDNNEKKQIKDTMSRNWTLSTKKIPWEVAEKLVYNQMLANQILITDYSIYAESLWRRIDVKLSEIDKRDFYGNPNKMYNFTLVDTKNIYEKRNF